jgi:hypothetical protein
MPNRRAAPTGMRPPPALSLQVEIDGSIAARYRLQRLTIIGRDAGSDIAIDNQYVSRTHVEVSFRRGSWWAFDAGSTNGLYVNDHQVERVELNAPVSIRLGTDGPTLRFAPEVHQPKAAAPADKLSHVIDHYFGAGDTPAGEHTMVIRRAFQQVHTRQRRRYQLLIGTVLALFLVAGAYGVRLYLQTSRQRQLAEEIFYNMKSLELDIARTERAVLNAGADGRELEKARERRQDLERNYERFLTEIGIYTKKLPEDERLILRMARVFGESELGMPPDFTAEVKSYIRKWQSTSRLKDAVALSASRNYPRLVTDAMLAEDLPPQFFYVALQESSFNAYAVGPPTYKGFAKGAWQFIPETAIKYGLKLGPQFELPRPDPGDDRHNFEKSTRDAAKYLKFLYSTEAQASGLLVMASYNWGEDRVVPLIRRLPENPRERNFWQLRAKYREQIPAETYNYVLSIFSAAVIGENPRLFGFDFDSPLRIIDRS